MEADEITHGGHPGRYDRPADQLEVLGFQTQGRLVLIRRITSGLPVNCAEPTTWSVALIEAYTAEGRKIPARLLFFAAI
jgi:hypothetical protein